MEYYLGIDLGGTNIVAALVDKNARIVAKDTVRTNMPRSTDSICDDMAMLCQKLLAGAGLTFADVPWVGIGSPGMICGNVIVYSANLDFHNVSLAELLSQRMGVPVLLENDGNAAALGELFAGAGKGHSSLIEITLGTGVGGGIVIDGKVYSGSTGAAGEVGHMVIHPGGRLCTCGHRGCLEAYCSAVALRAMTQEALESNPESKMKDFLKNGKVSAKTAFDAARAGDEAGAQVVEEFLEHLAMGIANLTYILQPEIICLGGGVAYEGDAIVLPLRERLAQMTHFNENQRPQIVAGVLGNDAGLIGAALQGLQHQ